MELGAEPVGPRVHFEEAFLLEEPSLSMDEVKLRILEILRKDNGGLKVAEIAEKVGIPWQRIVPIIRILMDENSVVKTDSTYRLLTPGTDSLTSMDPSGREEKSMPDEKKEDLQKSTPPTQTPAKDTAPSKDSVPPKDNAARKEPEKPKATTPGVSAPAYTPSRPPYGGYAGSEGSSSKWLMWGTLLLVILSLIIGLNSSRKFNALIRNTQSDIDGISTLINSQSRTMADSIDDLKFRTSALETNYGSLQQQVAVTAQIMELRKAIMILDQLSQVGEGKIKTESDRISSEIENLVNEMK